MTRPVFTPGVDVQGFPVQFERDQASAAQAARGEPNWQPVGPLDPKTGRPGPTLNCVVLLAAPFPRALEQGKPDTQEGQLAVPSGADVQNGDRFFWGGSWYGVEGQAQFDFPHVLTGEVYGYSWYTILKGG